MLPESAVLQLDDEYLRMIDLKHRYKVGASTIYDWINKQGYPKPYKLGPKLSRWKLSDCIAWENQSRKGEA